MHPSVLPHWTSSKQGSGGKDIIVADSSKLGATGVVSSTIRSVDQGSLEAPIRQSLVTQPQGSDSSPGTSGVSSFFGLDDFRLHAEESQFSSTAQTLMVNSIRPSTRKAYRSCWRRWMDWCSERSLGANSPALSDLANYLSFLFEEGLAPRSLALHKSAIISILSLENERFSSFSKADCLNRIIKGAFNSRPPLKSTEVWDIEQVLSCLRSWGPNTGLSVKQLMWKSLALIAIVSACRVSDLASLSSQIRRCPEVWTFNFIKKNSSMQDCKVEINIFAFADPIICPLECLSQYLERSQLLRTNSTTIFITLSKPHRNARPNTLSKHLKHVLSLAGIDISSFTGHSFRSATTSKAFVKGVDLTDIMQRATWATPSMFTRFYAKKPSRGASFSHAVLSS
jgi:integrase